MTKRQVPQLRSVREIVKNFNRMICDNSFQRDFVWNLDKQREYISTVIAGGASSAIILADIPSCLTASEHRGSQYGIQRLKGQHEEGYVESKIDGHQRTTTLHRFCNNEFTISGNFIDVDGITHTIKNQYFRDLPNSLRDTFLYSNVVVTVISGFSFNEIIKQFVDIQKGDHLTHAEIRWASMTPYNPWVKKRRETYKAALEKVEVFAKKSHRKLDVEVFDQTILQLMPSTKQSSTFQSNLDAWYAYGEGRGEMKYVEQYKTSELDRAWNIFQKLISPILVKNKIDYGKVAVRTYWAIVAASEYLWDNGYEVSDYSDMYNLIKQVNNDLYQDSKIKQAAETKAARQSNSMQDDPPDNKYYWYWCGVPHAPADRTRKINAFIAEFTQRLSKASCAQKRSIKAKAA